jgi:hypothetical protein
LHEERASGVGCEACHGPASRWLEPHKKHGWRENKDPKELEELGWKSLDNLGTRAKTCAGCHVGASPGKDSPEQRDVNHDLIAAGHPRLHFEFASFTANMPRHWQKTPEEEQKGYEAKVWAVGQVAGAEAALELLAYHAQPAKDRPWPEFAAYDCFACHHDLRQPSWRQTSRHYGQRQPGSLPWDPWYYSMLPILAEQQPVGVPKIAAILDPLVKTMGRPFPPRNQAAGEAAAAARRLMAWRREMAREKVSTKFKPRFARKLLVTLAENEKLFARAGWDGAEQFYLAAVALTAALGDKTFVERHRNLLKERAFPQGQDSPRDFDANKFCADLRQVLGH